MSVEIELVDPWHEPGYRIRVETEPERLTTIAVGDVEEVSDPVTKRRPSDRETGEYRPIGRTPDGVRIYSWSPPSESGPS